MMMIALEARDEDRNGYGYGREGKWGSRDKDWYCSDEDRYVRDNEATIAEMTITSMEQEAKQVCSILHNQFMRFSNILIRPVKEAVNSKFCQCRFLSK